MIGFVRVAVAEIRYLAQCVGYAVRPYDDLLDARRWRWGKRGICQFRAARTGERPSVLDTPKEKRR